jgi:hypothetical protein
MVYLYSIISGFRAVLGSVAIQGAMGFSVLFFVKVPVQPYVTEPYEGANAELVANLTTLDTLMILSHFFCVSCILGSQLAKRLSFAMVNVLVVLAMVL